MIQVLSTGSGLSIQDIGRLGWRRYGVPSGGAMDRQAMRVANELLGNLYNAPVLEIMFQGTQLKFEADMWVAIAGADFCTRIDAGTAVRIQKGEVLQLDKSNNGIFTYLAVPGGFNAVRYLDSASTDLRNGMGQAIRGGDSLRSKSTLPNISTDRIARRIHTQYPAYVHQAVAEFQLFPGPQFASFAKEQQERFIQSTWKVSKQLDRTGYRLEGAAIETAQSIPSEPVLPGSFQVPGNGLPIITMADGPTVGGYPKIAILQDGDLDRLAQCAPGTELRFSWL